MEYKRYQHPTIELCKDCEGTGTMYEYHEHDILRQEPIPVTCTTCEGSGRVLVSKITVITVKPFKQK
ncbi:MAG TPA: hypothetical protein VIK29_07165 [Paludibacter sp.]